MPITSAPATAPDLLRLVAVPVFAWAAVRDVRTRRVSSAIWIPLSGLGAILLLVDARHAYEAGGAAWTHDFLLPTAIGIGFVVPLAYLFWWVGGFGGADAKALMTLALLVPTVPRYDVAGWTLPLSTTPVGAFSFTVLTNAVLIGVCLPLALAVRNAAAGRIAPVMVVGWPVPWEAIPERHGRLLETPAGLSRGGLDLDALRMYLRWRGCSLADVREAPERYRDPSTLPDEPNPPTDGAVHATVENGSDDSGAPAEDGGVMPDLDDPAAEDGGQPADHDDPWGAAAFLDDIEGSAYGTAADDLRDGLDALCAEDVVWISPGAPFVVPIFVGLVVALTYGDLLVGLLV